MQKLFFCVVLSWSFLFIPSEVFSQCSSGGEPECTCGTAPVLCTVDELDGYCFSMSSYQHPPDAPSPLCPGVPSVSNNPHWFAFTAWCTDLTLDVTPSNCSPNPPSSSLGVQTVIYGDCGYNEIVDCDAASSGCNAGTTRTLFLTGLTIGDIYYFLVDGCSGSFCDICIDVVGVCGEEEIEEWTNPVTEELKICAGSQETYNVDDLAGALFFHWYIDGVLQDDTMDPTWTYTWNTPGVYELCVDASNDPCVPENDDPLPNCVTITVIEAEAGTLDINPNPLCPNDLATILATGYLSDPDYSNAILIVDGSGNIVQVDPGDMATFTHDMCESFTVYSYNYYSADGAVPPMVGDNISSIDCNVDCCDLESEPLDFTDTEDPVITVPMVPTYACYDDFINNSSGIPDADWTDNCDGSGMVMGVETGTANMCDGGTLKWTYTYMDLCGNMAEEAVDIVIPPLVAPDWTGTLPDPSIDIICGDPIPDPIEMFLDNGEAVPCNIMDGPLLPTLSGDVPPTTCGDVLIRTWEYTDVCGNVLADLVQNVNLIDNVNPVFDNPPAALPDLICDEDLPMQEVLTGTDNCNPPTVTPTVDPYVKDVCAGYTITYRWTIEDECMNSDEVSVSFDVLPDNDPPVFDAPPSPLADLACDDPRHPIETLTATEGCGTVTIDETETFTEDLCGGYTVTIEWIAEDECSNTAMEQISYNVAGDTAPPMFNGGPSPIGPLNCDEAIPPQETLTATDDCGMVTIVEDSDSPTPDLCNGYDITYTWTATDECSNETSTSLVITILPDTTPPDMTLSSVDETECENVPPIEDPDVTDDCTPAGNIIVNFLGEVINSMGNCTTSIERTWEAIDECGNSTGPMTQVIDVKDYDAPIFDTPPPNEIIDCGFSVPPMEDLTWTDNCSPDGVSVGTQVGDPLSLVCDGGNITRTWEAIDECGNVTMHTQTITIEPKPPVVWIGPLPDNVTILCGEPEPSPVTLQYTNNANDPMCLEDGSIDADPPVGELLLCGDTKTYTWEYTSECGDVLMHTWTITLQDINPPTWVSTPPASINITCLNDLPAVQDLEWMDDCDGSGFVPYTEIGTLNLCTGGSINRTWEYTDECGNGPLVFTQNIILPAPGMASCDDGDPCTENDMGIQDCEGNFCTCEGTLKPDIMISGSTTFCIGFSTNLDAGPGVSYAWNNGLTTQVINVTVEGTYTVTVTDIDGCMRSSAVAVNESNELNPVILGDLEKCFYETTDLDAGAGFNTYDWNDGSAGQFLNGVDIGTYEVTVSDINGCTGTSAVEVTNHPILTLDITGDEEFCQFDFTDLFATPGFSTYSWSNGLGGEQISVNTPGTYMVTATDQFGCQYTADFVLTENLLPNPFLYGETFFCEGGDTEISTDDFYTEYIWSNGDTDFFTYIDAPGLISVTVTDDNGCTNSVGILVEEYATPEPTITGSLAICLGNSTTLSTQDFFLYVWSDGSSDQSITVDQPGTYSVYVETQFGCWGETEVDVIASTSLLPNISGDTILCNNESSVLDAGVFLTYLWNDPNGSTTQTITIDSGGVYSVTVSDGGGCTGSSFVTVYSASDNDLNIMGDPFYCNGESTFIYVDSTYVQYSWSTGETNDTITVDMEGDFSVTVTDSNGCTASDEITVLASEIPPVAISGLTDFCLGDSVLLEANGMFANWLWSTGDTLSSIYVDTSGLYAVTVTDSIGCQANTSISITQNPEANPTIGGSSSYCVGSSTLLDGGMQYVDWNWSTGETTQTISVSSEMTVGLTITDVNGCTGSSSIDITEETSLNPAITGDTEFCEGGNGVLDGGSNFGSWMWNTGETTQTITIDSAGTYSITVTDISGDCTGEGSVVVITTPNPIPEITGDNKICPNEMTELSLTEVYATYEWSTGDNGPTLNVDSGGTFDVTVTDSQGCSGTTSYDVMLNSNPSGSISSVACSQDLASYSFNVVTDADSISTSISSTITDLGSGTFLIENVDTISSVTVLIVNSITQCDTSIIVSPPNCNCDLIADAGIDQQIDCNNLIVTVGGPNTTVGPMVTYEWLDENDNLLGIDLNLMVDSAGIYTIVVTDNELDCSFSDQVEVTESIIAPASLSSLPGFCPGDMIEISVSPNYEQYAWDTGESTASIFVDQAGIYTVTVTDINNCTTTATTSVEEYLNPNYSYSTECNDALDQYLIEMITDADVLTTNVGDITTTNDGFLIENIDTSETLSFSLSFSSTLCSIQESILPPNCLCDIVADAGANVTFNCNITSTVLGGINTSQGSDISYQWIDQNGDELSTDINYTATEAGTYTLIVTDNILNCEVRDQVAISLDADPVPVIIGNQEFCIGQNSMIGTDADFDSYEWNTGETTKEILVDADGPYTVTVTDGNGCTGTAEYIISTNPLPSFTYEAECASDKASYTVTIKTDADMLLTNTGTIVDQNDCFLVMDIDTLFDLEITLINSTTTCEFSDLIPKPDCQCTSIADAGLPMNLNCDVKEVEIGSLNSSQGNDYSYTWLDSNNDIVGTTLNITVDIAGTYTLIVYDILNDCDATDMVIINDLSNQPIAFISANPDNIIDCLVESVTLTADDVPNGIYNWNSNDATFSNVQSITVEESGTYNLIVLDTITGCIGRDSIIVLDQEEYPAISIDEPDPLDCEVIEVTISAQSSQTGGSIIHSWLDSDQNIIAGQTDLEIQVNEAGTYYFMSIDPSNGCENIDSVVVTSNVSYPGVDAGDDYMLPCTEGSINIVATVNNAGSENDIIWSTGATNVNEIEVESTGWYYITITNRDNGCSAVDSTFVDINTNYPGFDQLGLIPPTCFGNNDGVINVEVISGGVPPYQYILGNQVNDNGIFGGLSAGEYDITVIDDLGCEKDTTVIILEPELVEVVIDSSEATIKLGDSLQVFVTTNIPEADIDTIIWNPDEVLSCNNCLDPFIQTLQTQTYNVTVIDKNGCEDNAQINIRVDKRADVYIGNVFSPNGDGRNDIIFVQSDIKIKEVLNFEIYDRWGELVFGAYNFEPNDPDFGWDGMFRGERASNAVYVYKAVYRTLAGDEALVAGDITLIR